MDAVLKPKSVSDPEPEARSAHQLPQAELEPVLKTLKTAITTLIAVGVVWFIPGVLGLAGSLYGVLGPIVISGKLTGLNLCPIAISLAVFLIPLQAAGGIHEVRKGLSNCSLPVNSAIEKLTKVAKWVGYVAHIFLFPTAFFAVVFALSLSVPNAAVVIRRLDTYIVLMPLAFCAIPSVVCYWNCYALKGAIKTLRSVESRRDKITDSNLIAALSDENEKVRLATVGTLGNLGPEAKDSLPALILALNDNSPNVRRAVAFALGKMGPTARDAVPALTVALQDDDSHVRANAEAALKDIEAGK